MVTSAQLDAFADALYSERPSWIAEGSLGQTDTRFLFRTAFHSRARHVAEIGTASGFSTLVICHALKLANEAGLIPRDFSVASYDVLKRFYADSSKLVGDAVRERLPRELLKHVNFHNPATVADLPRFHSTGEIQLLFIDADHRHPSPTVDLLRALPYLAPSATVVLHDINLPLCHPTCPDWGVKYLFDALEAPKQVEVVEVVGYLPNIGSFVVPENREKFASQLRHIIYAHDWQAPVNVADLQVPTNNNVPSTVIAKQQDGPRQDVDRVAPARPSIASLQSAQIELRPAISAALRRTYYSGFDDRQLATDEIAGDIDDHVFRRYERVLTHYVPWVTRVFDLSDKEIVEIGSGTGSSTAAFSPFCKQIYAYDIAGTSVMAAQARLQIMGITNVSVCQSSRDDLLLDIKSQHASGVAAVMLFAVLAHMTIEERLNTLRVAWETIRPGGILIVAETPNRLTYRDFHTSWLPFFHQLPLELAVHYYDRSPRVGFRTAIREYLDKDDREGAQMCLVRWGNGVSYHEFELALGSNLEDLLIADGDAAEMRSLYPVSDVELLLRQFFVQSQVNQPVAFANQIFNLIFQKKGEE